MTVGFVIFFVVFAAVVIYGTKYEMENSPWDTYSECKCGKLFYAPFGDKFHIHKDVCPSCGTNKREWSPVKTMRQVKGKWETKDNG